MSKSGSGTDQKFQQGAWNNLNSVFNTSQQQSQQLGQTGTQLQGTGIQDIGQASNYWKNLLQGNRQQTMAAVAPAANAAVDQADASKRQEAEMGTGRGGGTNAIDQQRATNTQSQIDTLIGGVAPTAASNLASEGATVAGIGSQDISAMLNALGIGFGAEANLGSQSTQADIAARQAQAQLWSSVISAAGSLGGAGIIRSGMKPV